MSNFIKSIAEEIQKDFVSAYLPSWALKVLHCFRGRYLAALEAGEGPIDAERLIEALGPEFDRLGLERKQAAYLSGQLIERLGKYPDIRRAVLDQLIADTAAKIQTARPISQAKPRLIAMYEKLDIRTKLLFVLLDELRILEGENIERFSEIDELLCGDTEELIDGHRPGLDPEIDFLIEAYSQARRLNGEEVSHE